MFDFGPHSDVLILGAGIAGLSCRFALSGHRDTLVLERENRPGGLLKMHQRGDFIFDTVLHVLTLRDPSVRILLTRILPMGFHTLKLHRLIWQKGHVIDYPYQFNIRQLPYSLQRNCLEGFLSRGRRQHNSRATFEEWLLAEFGEGFYRHFFEKYNHKLYGVHPSELDAAPMVWMIPAGDERMILEQSRESPQDQMPLECFYPRGPLGIFAIADALLQQGNGPIAYSCEAVSINTDSHRVLLADGREVVYESLVSSLPLPSLVRLFKSVPIDVRTAAARLDAATVHVIHVGSLERTEALDAHWTYFPDKEVPFYRMTRLDRISPDLCSPGSTALLLECSGESPPLRDDILRTLDSLGILPHGRTDQYDFVTINHAYVRFRPGFVSDVEIIKEYLQDMGIFLIGRYGTWRYLNIEQTIISGMEMACRLIDIV